jgi:hypothetical protein
MTECNQLAFEFPGFRGRKIGADFGGGNVSSDGGLLLLRQVDRFSGLIKNLGSSPFTGQVWVRRRTSHYRI